MSAYSQPRYASGPAIGGTGPVSLAFINSQIKQASLTPLINLEGMLKATYGNTNYQGQASIKGPRDVEEYAKSVGNGPEYPRILDERSRGLKEVPGDNPNIATYSMVIPLAESRRAVMSASGTIDDKIQGNKKTGPDGSEYKRYVFAYNGVLYVMPSEVRRQASEYFEKMRAAANKMHPNLAKKSANEIYEVSVRDLGKRFEIVHEGSLTRIKYVVTLPKLVYRNSEGQMPTGQLHLAA